MPISKSRFTFLIIFLTAFAVFSFSFPYNFLYESDDIAYIFQNPYLKQISLENIWNIFSNFHVFFTYIPFTNISYSIDFSIWGLYAPGFRLTQVLLHGANSVLIFVILNRLIAVRSVPFLTAILFAIHPLNIETVVWISERKNILSSFFSLLSFFYYIQFVKSENLFNRKYYYLSFLFFFCGLLSKSISVVMPAVMVWADFCIFRRGWRLREKVPFFLLSLIMVFLTLVYEGKKAGALVPYAGGSFWISFLYTFRVYGDYVSTVFFPVGLSPYYHYIYSDLESAKTFVCYIAIPGIIYWAIKYKNERPLIAFGIGWFVLWLVPVSNFIPLNTLRQDRYLYLPAIAILAFISWGLCNSRLLKRKTFFYGLTFFIGCCFTGVTLQYMKVFKDIRPYWLHIAKICPNWAEAQFEAGLVERNAKNIESSVYFYQKALNKNPDLIKALNNYGATLSDQGQYLRAKPYIIRAQKLNPQDPDPYYNLAIIESKTGNDKKRVKELLKLHVLTKEKIKPKDYNLGPNLLNSDKN